MKRLQLVTIVVLGTLTSIVPLPARADDALIGCWQGDAVREGKSWRLRLLVTKSIDKLAARVDFPDYGVYGIRLGLEHRAGSIVVRGLVRDSFVTLEARLDGEEIRGTFKGTGRDFKPRAVEAPFALVRCQPAPPVIDVEEVRLRNGDVTLTGTLVKPATGGPHPAIVWTHGSGNQSRRTTFYASRAYLAAEHGVASLIYDKRGVGESSGDWKEATLVDLAEDAICWVRALADRSDVNPRHVGVGGMSQGAWIAPLAASRSRQVAFVLVGSVPGITPQEQNNFSVESRLKSGGIAQADLVAIMALRRRCDAVWRTGNDREGAEAALKSARERHGNESWFEHAWLPEPPLMRGDPEAARDYLLVDPAVVWKGVSVPTLAVWGALDSEVPAELSRQVLEKALQEAGNHEVTLRVFPNAGHGLALLQQAQAEWDWPRLAPGYDELVTTWLETRRAVASAPQ